MLTNRKMQKYVQEHPCGLACYITAGYPDKESFFQVLKDCSMDGMSIIEIGFPSENPYADGEVIKKAHQKVDKSIAHDMDFWRKIRKTVDNPIWIMGYYKDLCETGIYLTLAQLGLVDVYVIPDAKIEEALRLQKELQCYGVEVIGFTLDIMQKEEIDVILNRFPLIYQQLYKGVTGMDVKGEEYRQLLQYSRNNSDDIIFAGFGISSGKRVRELLELGFYGVVIGTAVIRAMNESETKMCNFLEELKSTIILVEGGRKKC